MRTVKAKITMCECGRINLCQEDEHEHISQTGHKTKTNSWLQSDDQLSKTVGIQLLAYDRGFCFAKAGEK